MTDISAESVWSIIRTGLRNASDGQMSCVEEL